MARTDNLTNYLTDVAKAIKEKKGDNTPIKASEFDTEITNLPSGGGDIDEYFETTVTDDNHKYFIHNVFKKLPPIKVETKNLSGFFNYYKGDFYPELDTSEVTDFSSFFSSNDATELPLYDTSNATNLENFCTSCKNLLVFPQINTSKVTNVKGMCANDSKLTTIPELDFGSVTNSTNFVQSCSVLTTLGGFKDYGKAFLTTTSANNSSVQLTLTACPKLTKASVLDVFNKLADLTGKNTQKITLHSNVKALLNDEDIAIATNKNWTVS